MVRIDQGQGVLEIVRGGSGEKVRRIQRLWSQLAGFCEGAGSSCGEVSGEKLTKSLRISVSSHTLSEGGISMPSDSGEFYQLDSRIREDHT